MGRLFWKFFALILLVQIAGVVTTGAVFWLERQHFLGQPERPPHPHPPPPREGMAPPPPPRHGPPFRLPWVPIAMALLVSVGCAALLAAYVARPIRRLRSGFDAVAQGRLDVRIAAGMGRRDDELAALGSDFDRMADRLETLVTGQRQLLHDVSHELRSPLARLQAAIGLIDQNPDSAPAMLARLERECVRMDRLVGELLTLSRLNAGEGWPLTVIDLGEVLLDLVDDARFEAADRRVRIVLSGADAPVPVLAHAELLHRAFDNVLRNALRHSPDGGGVGIDISKLAGSRYRVRVCDQGPGVPEEQLEMIFQPFFRTCDKTPGYGLGLAIARRALAAVNAEIRAKPGVGGGLVIEVELDAADQAAVSTGATKT